MTGKSILDQAKAYLCWDIFRNMNIQLVGIQSDAAYFFPPRKDDATIVVFYRDGNEDMSRPLFLLFHEAGHWVQFAEYRERGREKEFYHIINSPTGTDRYCFEKQAWAEGGILLRDFAEKHHLPVEWLDRFDRYAEESLASYQ